jgi:hypothetical protein
MFMFFLDTATMPEAAGNIFPATRTDYSTNNHHLKAAGQPTIFYSVGYTWSPDLVATSTKPRGFLC